MKRAAKTFVHIFGAKWHVTHSLVKCLFPRASIRPRARVCLEILKMVIGFYLKAMDLYFFPRLKINTYISRKHIIKNQRGV
jgi:hypothetical protein